MTYREESKMTNDKDWALARWIARIIAHMNPYILVVEVVYNGDGLWDSNVYIQIPALGQIT